MRGTEIIDAETGSQTGPAAKQRLPAETDAGAKSPHSGAIDAKRLTKVSPLRLGGGRTGARTWDPMIKRKEAPQSREAARRYVES
jgi:hypothetical protein